MLLKDPTNIDTFGSGNTWQNTLFTGGILLWLGVIIVVPAVMLLSYAWQVAWGSFGSCQPTIQGSALFHCQ